MANPSSASHSHSSRASSGSVQGLARQGIAPLPATHSAPYTDLRVPRGKPRIFRSMGLRQHRLAQ
ncbi:hypothetical protein KL86DES1_20325 [uncultured Desulfovibrio sp.]|uniref:Uncharacterized protein n=1 Tax=uncultured Desulfovibrio sp. TaxID=167968 RepID=A0A212L346_9BACT|nr:hypothetical protein KL86DES1_20325 [uncultured Desulfovibrio sp.]